MVKKATLSYEKNSEGKKALNSSSELDSDSLLAEVDDKVKDNNAYDLRARQPFGIDSKS